MAWRGLQRRSGRAVGVFSVPSCVNDSSRGAECTVGALRVRRVESENQELEGVRGSPSHTLIACTQDFLLGPAVPKHMIHFRRSCCGPPPFMSMPPVLAFLTRARRCPSRANPTRCYVFAVAHIHVQNYVCLLLPRCALRCCAGMTTLLFAQSQRVTCLGRRHVHVGPTSSSTVSSRACLPRQADVSRWHYCLPRSSASWQRACLRARVRNVGPWGWACCRVEK